jgi:hypothetical protein
LCESWRDERAANYLICAFDLVADMARRRFQLRTLLVVTAAIALTAGAMRWWYDAQVAEYERQKQIVDQLGKLKVTFLWTAAGPDWLTDSWTLDERVFMRPTHGRFDEVATEAFAEIAAQLEPLDLYQIDVFGRQILPHVDAVRSGRPNDVIDALRRHPTLRRIFVDASIRGTPPEFDAPIYTRKKLAALEAVLPSVSIIWTDVN